MLSTSHIPIDIHDHYFAIYITSVNKKQCLICLDKKQNFISIEKCSHHACQSCTKSYFINNINQGCRRLQDFKCIVEGCIETYTQNQLQSLLEFQYFNKLTNKVIFWLSLLCPQCRNRCDFKSNQQLVCLTCSTKICNFCKAVDHDGRCKTQNKYFKEVRSAIQDQQIGICPKCTIPFMKDENCDHVTCQNPQCSFEFCFHCSVPFDPVNYHGGAYHRNDCRNYYYDDYEQQYATYDPSCRECVKLHQSTNEQKVCLKPVESRDQFLKSLITKIQI